MLNKKGGGGGGEMCCSLSFFFRLTAPFNKHADSEVQDSINCYTFHCHQSLQQTSKRGSIRSKIMFVHYDWRIWIHFVGFCIFCGQLVVAVIIMINSSKICKSLVGLKFRVCTVHDLERHSKNYGNEY